MQSYPVARPAISTQPLHAQSLCRCRRSGPADFGRGLAIFILLVLGLWTNTSAGGDPAVLDYPTSKRWLHRANTIEKANTGLQSYPGMEVDVIYYQGADRFDVRHRWFAMASGLTLANLLAETRSPDLALWLDFKNATWWNAPAAAKRMLILIHRHNLAGRVVVEAKEPAALEQFNKLGIATSYWVEHFEPGSRPLEQLRETAQALRETLDRYQISAISCHYEMVPFLQEYLPGVRLHVWTNGLKLPRDEARIAELEAVPMIKVILVDHEH